MTDPSTKTANAATPAVVHVRAARLEVKRGPDRGLEARVVQPSFVVGAGPEADLRLTDRTVSRDHLHITLTADGVHLRDRGSKNGTRIGNVRVSDVTLTADTVVEVGSSMVAFSIERVPLALEVSPRASFGGAIGVSPIMRNLFATLEPVAMSEATVLLEGETGAGKDVLARAIHASSSRAKGPFVVVDCGSIPSALVESELFGHEKGAFTGAQQARRGLFEEASSGTLFLDEVGELPLDMQPKLLRALEQREVRPVGGRTPRHVDVRVIAATNKRLAEAVRNKEFRQDLFYRLAVVRVNVPPLRDRSEDIVPLATSFLRAIKGDPSVVVAPDLAKLLTSYAWPGNVRELRNVIERYALAGAYTEGLLDDDGAAHLERGASADISKTPYHEARRANDDRFDREYLTRLLERTGGVMARAADEAGLARPSLYRMMDRLGVKRDEDG